LVSAEQLTGAVEVRTLACSGCGGQLEGDDSAPFRYQVAELPEVFEYRLETWVGLLSGAERPSDPRGTG